MFREKRIKLLIIISLLLVESFVWTAYGVNNSWSLGILGGADGPTAFFIGKAEKPKDEKADQNKNPDVKEAPDQSGELEQTEGNQAESEADNLSENEENGQEYNQEAGDKGLLILVNKKHPVDQNYKPDDLVEIKYFVADRSPAARYMRAEAANAFHQMVEKAAESNLELKMTTAYRSYNFQKLLYDSYVEKEGVEAASKFSAQPGQSEHQTGLAVDVSSPSVDYQLSNDYGKTEEGKWLASHAHEFGFIIRFPKGKEDITGYQYEPWHIRYVGLKAAKEIYEQNLTLEEYLQQKDLQ